MKEAEAEISLKKCGGDFDSMGLLLALTPNIGVGFPLHV